MAELGSLVVSLSLDANNFNGNITQANRHIKAMGSELQAIKAKGSDYEKSLEGMGRKKDVLTRQTEASRLKLEELRKAYDKNVESGDKSAAQMERLANAVNRAEADYNRLERELAEVTEELRVQSSQWTQAGQKMQDVGGKLKSVGDGMTSIGKDLSMKVTAPIVALGTGAFKAAVDFESAFAGVRKTVDTTEEGFAKLEKGIRDMARELPASASDIAAVAESAGQLGIAEDKILSFSRTIIDLGESTNMTREQAATEFARFANIVGMSQDNFDRLGSSIVGLGNTMATTESEIMSMGMRLAAQGAQIGMSEAQIMALAGTMSSLGIQAEMGGTAMTTILKKIQSAVGSGGKDLEDFAKVAGMTGTEFKKAFEADAVTALDALVKGLAKSSGEGANLTSVLADLGMKGVYESDVMLRLAGASDLLSESVKTSTSAWEENSALSNEAAQRYETTASQMAMLKNQTVDVGISLGQTLIPMAQGAMDKIGGLVEKFSDLSPEAQKSIVAIGGIVAAAGPLLVIGGSIMSGIGGMVTTVGALSTAIGAAGGLSAVMGSLGTTLGVLAGPVGWTALGIAAIGTAAVIVGKEMSESSIQLQDWSEGVSEATAEAVGGFVKISDEVGQTLSTLHLTSTRITDEISTDMTSKFDAMYSQIVEGANEKHAAHMESLQNFFLNSSALTSEEEAKILEKRQQSYDTELEILAAKNQIVAEIMQKASEENRALTEQERDVINNINQQMKEDAVRVLSESEVEQKVILEKMKADASEISALQAAEVVKNAVEQKEKVIEEANKQYEEKIALITRMRDETGDISAEQAERMIAEAKKSRDQTIGYAEEMHENIVSEAKAQAGEHVDQVEWETGEIKSKWEVMKVDVSKKMKEIGTNIKKDWTQAYNDATKWVSDMATKVDDKFQSMGKNVGIKMNEIKGSISDKIEEARDAVKTAIDKMLGFFNFEWSLPKLKLPRISISGEFSLNPPKVPSFGIDWFAKGGLMTSPTIFGMNGNRLMAGGEAGPEAILPLNNKVLSSIGVAIADTINIEGLTKLLNQINKSIYKDEPQNTTIKTDSQHLDLSKLLTAMDKIASRPVEVGMNIDGREFVKAVINHINDAQHQQKRQHTRLRGLTT